MHYCWCSAHIVKKKPQLYLIHNYNELFFCIDEKLSNSSQFMTFRFDFMSNALSVGMYPVKGKRSSPSLIVAFMSERPFFSLEKEIHY